MRRLVGAFAAAVLIATCLPVAQTWAVESGGIGGRPAQPDPKNPRSESIFVFSLDAGDKAENGVRIYNNTSQQKTIAVYPVDSQVSSGGAFACAQRADEKREVGSWMQLAKESVTLAPGSYETIPFTLAVPKDTPSGEHNGCIAIQSVNEAPEAAGNGITLSFRSAIRVAVTVSGEIRKGLTFTRLNYQESAPGKWVVNTALKNSGNVSIDTAIDSRIKTLFGTTVSQGGGEFPVLSGGESEFNFDTPRPFWGGIYFLTTKASYNNDVTSALGSGDKSAHISKSKVIAITPKPQALAIELLALAAVVLGAIYYIKRRRVHLHWRKKGDIYTVQKGDDIQQVAKAFDVSWKTLAKVNKLKAPYLLQAGQQLTILGKTASSKTVRSTETTKAAEKTETITPAKEAPVAVAKKLKQASAQAAKKATKTKPSAKKASSAQKKPTNKNKTKKPASKKSSAKQSSTKAKDVK